MHKNIKSLIAALALVGAAGAVPASATTITFEGLATSSTVQNGYAGLNWKNVFVQSTVNATASGYVNGVVSGSKVALINPRFVTSISAISSPFTLNSGFFMAGWNDGLVITALGFVDGVQSYSTSFTVGTAASSFQTFNWTNLSQVSFSATGGVNHGYSGAGTHFAFDNLVINEAPAVPEPATWAMMLVGFGAIGAGVRSRRNKTVRVTYA